MKFPFVPLLAAFALFSASASAQRPDIVIADFEGDDYGAWKATGTAFGPGPAHGTLPQQKPVEGFVGQGLVNSFLSGDKATGTLTSPEFKLERKFIGFLIGGGGWEGKTCLNLVIGGKVVRTATGPHTQPGGSEQLARAGWNVEEFAGQMARLTIMDEATSGWGHINVDRIVQTDTAPSAMVAADGELLYNGIRLPARWPPIIEESPDRTPIEPPWLKHPPAVIPIDVGRQLFVDDFLIEKTDLTRTFHRAQKHERNPVLKPETALELNDGRHPCATLFNDAVWYDPQDRFFKMWYHAGWFDGTALATSKDGLQWERPALEVAPGTNRVMPVEGHGHRDGCAVWLDHFARDSQARFKMFLYERPEAEFGGQIFTSPDGVHWHGPTRTSYVGDNTTIHYNPFRKKWIYSVRTSHHGARVRSYRECDDLVAGAVWQKNELVFWAGADALDPPDPAIGDRTQLYNLDTIAYESLMLGLFTIHLGPANKVCEEGKFPKVTELELGYSRDGFHWHRPDRTPFIAATRKEGDWDRAYLHAAASVCAIVGDRVYFYYGGWSGISPKLGSDIYAGGATGVAFLRRDGFASMDAGEKSGALTTRPISFQGKYLFVNASVPNGELRAEMLDEDGKAIEPFTLDNCVPIKSDKTDRTRTRIDWKGRGDLATLAGKTVRSRFQLTNGSLYAFWISPDVSGASYGYVAAGGPGFAGPRDTEGEQATH